MNQVRYFNRELSWLSFNQRVLHECLDEELSLSERLKFCAIFSNNLDEFFMIRVGGLIEQIFAGYERKDYSGMKPGQLFLEIRRIVVNLTTLQKEIVERLMYDEIKRIGINVMKVEELSPKQYSAMERHYVQRIFPVLTPMAVDFSRPFPLIANKSLNIVCKLVHDEDRYVTIQVPSVISRLVPVEGHMHKFLLLEDIIMTFAEKLFEGYTIEAIGIYRITRNGDITVDETDSEVADDLLSVIEASLKRRKWGEVIRLEVNSSMPQPLLAFLVEKLELEADDVYYHEVPLDLTCLFALSDMVSKVEPTINKRPRHYEIQEANLFEEIQQRDVFLHHPFDSFETITRFIQEAARDPHVLAIKQVLYRVGGDSPIVKALQEAASRGKQVTVLVELLARFDEENNINWAKALEKHGCHVIYGVEGYKTHAKIALIVRQEEEGIRRYVHLSTGNYNDKTAKIYTDVSLLTCHEQIAQDASLFFNVLSGYANQTRMQKLVSAPTNLKNKLLNLIHCETENAKMGLEARIVAKMNALVDSEIIEALYMASAAGVFVTLIVRGVCCLVPGASGLSENIRVISVIGSYLEHSRLFSFHNSGDTLVFIASADWMPRNLVKRIELMTPILDQAIKRECMSLLQGYIDTANKARYLLSSGLYVSAIKEKGALSMQQRLEVEHEVISG